MNILVVLNYVTDFKSGNEKALAIFQSGNGRWAIFPRAVKAGTKDILTPS